MNGFNGVLDRRGKALLITIVANVVLVLIKHVLAFLSGSMALRASAWHSMGDVFSSILVFIGILVALKISCRNSRLASILENIIALLIAGVIFFMAIDILREAIISVNRPGLRNVWPVMIGSLVTIAITYFTARYKEYVGKETECLSLLASGYHSKIDLYSSILVLISLATAALGLGALDRIVALLICFLILVSGWEIAGSAVFALYRLRAGVKNDDPMHGSVIKPQTLVTVFISSLAACILYSGFIVLQPDERGLVRRFGKVVREVGPGLNYHIPLIENTKTVSVDTVRTSDTGMNLVLTGDTNLIEVVMSVQYRVNNLNLFLFGNSNPMEFVKQYAESAMREIVAARSVDDLLVNSRKEILGAVMSRTQKLLDSNGAGVKIESIQFTSVNPPAEVAEAFRDVASAQEDKNTYISEAVAYQNEIVPISRGESAKTTLLAQADMQRRVDISFGEAERFSLRSKASASRKDVTKTRVYLETMERSLPKAKKVIVDPKVVTNPVQVFMSQGKNSLPNSY